MADVSLDDYINKKNFSVQIRNVGGNANTNRGGKSGFMKGRIKFTKQIGNNRGNFQKQGGNNKRGNFQKQGGINRVSFQKPKNITIQKQNNGRLSLQTKKNAVISLQTRKNKGLQDRSNTKPLTVVVPGLNKTVSGFNKGAFDARDRIAAAKRPQDARDKLSAKAKLSDARVKLQQIKNKQTPNKNGQVVITGLGKTMKTINTNIQTNPNLTRTLNNNQQTVQMSGNSMTITRNINNTNIPVNNQPDQGDDTFNFKITRTLGNRDNQQQSGVKMSGNSLTITRNTQQNVQMTNNRGPIIEVTNEQYQVPSDPSLDEYYEYDDEPSGYHYSQPETKTHVTEKTLTVKYPQAIRQKKTQIITTKPPVKPTIVTAVKRKAPTQGPLKLASSGPLRLGGPMVFATPTMVADTVDVIKKPKIVRPEVKQEYYEEEMSYQVPEPIPTMVSPLQGFKILVTNLHPVVSQDDIIELFGAVGPMKKAKLVKDGTAEVVYIQKDDAAKAIQKYHNRELDGIPMQVKLFVPKPPPKPVQSTPSVEEMPPPKVPGEPLKFFKPGSSKPNPDAGIDKETLHRALFKTGVTQPSKLVTFTVKI